MFAYIVVFTCVWWVIFFMVLPFNVQTTKKPELGHDDGAPVNPHIGMKMVITTIISMILTKLFIYIIDQGYLAKLADSYIEFLSSL